MSCHENHLKKGNECKNNLETHWSLKNKSPSICEWKKKSGETVKQNYSNQLEAQNYKHLKNIKTSCHENSIQKIQKPIEV